MSLIKEIAEKECRRQAADRGELHLYKEGSFLRAYEWSAWLACRYLHEFKVTKRAFKNIEEPVTFIGFPATSMEKWLPEGVDVQVVDEKHLMMPLLHLACLE